MAVDASRLKKLGRRSLGAPPTNGSPGIENSAVAVAEVSPGRPFVPIIMGAEYETGQANAEAACASQAEALATPEPVEAASPVAAPSVQESAASPDQTAEPVLNGAGEGELLPEVEDEPEATLAPRRALAAAGRGRGEQTASQRRQRVPPPEAEPRIPFTTRVSSSTKERLEDACHFLRRKHQDFINDAIIAHLKKHGF